MGLRDWTVGITDDGPDQDGVRAMIDCRPGRKMAWVSLADAFLDAPADDQRHTLVHELVHCHFEPADTLAHKFTSHDAFEAFRLMLEYGVDAMADVLAPIMPLPPVTKDDKPIGSKSSKAHKGKP